MTIKAIIFDFGGVFTNSPVSNFAKYERANGLPEKFIGGVIKTNMHDNAWAKLERSELTAKEFNPLFAAESKAMGHEISGDQLLELLYMTQYNDNMINALKCVHEAGFKTGCITNNLPKGAGGWAVDAQVNEKIESILSHFDHVIESARAGVRKPEPRIYEMMCEALDVPANACVFLDDLGINLKPARVMGMTTIKVPLDDVSPAVAELARITGLEF